MIIVMGHIRVRPEDTETFRRRLSEHAETVRGFDGCLHYAFSTDMGDPGLWLVSERWRDKPAQAAHMAGEHMARLNMMMKHVKIAEARIESFETDDKGTWVIRT
jgi:quinol monooxygenase YgiN